MAKGVIVLITFPFTDMSGSKLRPAVVLVDTSLDLTACFITTQTGWQEATDVLLTPSAATSALRQRGATQHDINFRFIVQLQFRGREEG
jgi:mRNA interferase MazF